MIKYTKYNKTMQINLILTSTNAEWNCEYKQ